jgi:hypothetical protein
MKVVPSSIVTVEPSEPVTLPDFEEGDDVDEGEAAEVEVDWEC